MTSSSAYAASWQAACTGGGASCGWRQAAAARRRTSHPHGQGVVVVPYRLPAVSGPVRAVEGRRGAVLRQGQGAGGGVSGWGTRSGSRHHTGARTPSREAGLVWSKGNESWRRVAEHATHPRSQGSCCSGLALAGSMLSTLGRESSVAEAPTLPLMQTLGTASVAAPFSLKMSSWRAHSAFGQSPSVCSLNPELESCA